MVELVARIQQRLGRPERVQIIPWPRANALAKAEPNVMLAAVVRTPEREAFLHFVGPVFTTRISAYVVKGRLDELRRRDPGLRKVRAGGQRASVFVSLPRRMGYNVTDEVNTAETAAKMLMSRRSLVVSAELILSPTHGGRLPRNVLTVDDGIKPLRSGICSLRR